MSYPRIEGDLEQIRVLLNAEQTLTLPRCPLPPAFLQWQSDERMRMFDQLTASGAREVRRQPAHLPVFATFGAGPFGVNLATRGMGPLPRPEHLAAFTEVLEEARRGSEGRPPEQTLPARVEAARTCYRDPACFDPRLLGGLEIFEGRTDANLRRNPLASLLYTGAAPGYYSYQLNGVAERIGEGDDYFRFLLAARQLFASDAFHIHQSRYPHGYLFHLSEALDKTPFSRG